MLKKIVVFLLGMFVYGNLYASEPVNFVVIGDMPYTEQDKVTLKALKKAIPALEPKVLIHYGDLMSGGESCTETLLTSRKEQIYAFLPRPCCLYPRRQ